MEESRSEVQSPIGTNDGKTNLVSITSYGTVLALLHSEEEEPKYAKQMHDNEKSSWIWRVLELLHLADWLQERVRWLLSLSTQGKAMMVVLATISGALVTSIRNAPFWEMLVLLVVVPIVVIEAAYRVKKRFGGNAGQAKTDTGLDAQIEVRDCQAVLDLYAELPDDCVQVIFVWVRIVNHSPEMQVREYKLEIVDENGHQLKSSRLEDASKYWQLELKTSRIGTLGGAIETKVVEPLRNLTEVPLPQNLRVDGWLAFCFPYEPLMKIQSVTLTLIDSSGRALQCIEGGSWNSRGEIVIKDDLRRIEFEDVGHTAPRLLHGDKRRGKLKR